MPDVPPLSQADLHVCSDAYATGRTPDRAVERRAVKAILEYLQRVAPGKSVELRIPPYAACQIVAGGSHRRGTPRATVETDAATLIGLATGTLAWTEARRVGRIQASGERSDLGYLFPCSE